MGIFDPEEDEDIDLNEFTQEPKADPVVEKKDEHEGFVPKEELHRVRGEVDDLKAQIARLSVPQAAAPVQQPAGHQPTLDDEVEQLLSQGKFAQAITHATRRAFDAGEQATLARTVPLAAQAARGQISKFINETPMTPSERKEFDEIVATATDRELAGMDQKQLIKVMDEAASLAAGRVARRTRNTRENEPPTYSTGSTGSFGSQRGAGKRKLTEEQKAAIELARGVLSEDEMEEILGGNR